jgi:hypothetical protein
MTHNLSTAVAQTLVSAGSRLVSILVGVAHRRQLIFGSTLSAAETFATENLLAAENFATELWGRLLAGEPAVIRLAGFAAYSLPRVQS